MANTRFWQVTTVLATAAALYFGVGSINQGAQLAEYKEGYTEALLALDSLQKSNDEMWAAHAAHLEGLQARIPEKLCSEGSIERTYCELPQ